MTGPDHMRERARLAVEAMRKWRLDPNDLSAPIEEICELEDIVRTVFELEDPDHAERD